MAVALFFRLDMGRFLPLDALKTNREILTSFYVEHRLATVLGFMSLYIIQTALSLPGVTIFSLSAGLLFGAIMGTVYAVNAAILGAVLAFLVARYLFHDTIQRKFGGSIDQAATALLFLKHPDRHYPRRIRLCERRGQHRDHKQPQ